MPQRSFQLDSHNIQGKVEEYNAELKAYNNSSEIRWKESGFLKKIDKTNGIVSACLVYINHNTPAHKYENLSPTFGVMTLFMSDKYEFVAALSAS